MSKFDKYLTRQQLVKNPEYCGQPKFVGFKVDEETGEEELNENGEKIPLFDQCGHKMCPRKMKNWIKWECTRNKCGGRLYLPRESQTYAKSNYEKRR